MWCHTETENASTHYRARADELGPALRMWHVTMDWQHAIYLMHPFKPFGVAEPIRSPVARNWSLRK